VGEAVDELKDGFKDGDKDVFEWVKANIGRFNNSSIPPGMEHMKMFA
jgi:hypothetical protein